MALLRYQRQQRTSSLRLELEHEVTLRLKAAGLAHALDAATEVIVFGSRATSVQRADSDLDLLLIGNVSKKTKTKQLDCICMCESDCESTPWLGSELASHIASYGFWLRGDGQWRCRAEVSDRAIANKQRRIQALVGVAEIRWQDFHRVFRAKYSTMIRRELQRLLLLQDRVAIPPTYYLDDQWYCGDLGGRLVAFAGDRLDTDHRLVSRFLRCGYKNWQRYRSS